ncbi:MAG TPA: SRPBCC family protein [Roseiflexaceae bacterium]|nr:SRPBCC family protein [Roseiflexaceae bacterium]
MPQAHAAMSAVVPAAPEEVYTVLADYRTEHPRILPRQYFTSLAVQQGGRGAGTVIRVTTRALGVERSYLMDVSEPEPGRRLVETDRGSGLATSFTVTPTGDGHSLVEIATTWETRPGIAGALERLTTAPIMRRIYAAELRQLAQYMRERAHYVAVRGEV